MQTSSDSILVVSDNETFLKEALGVLKKSAPPETSLKTCGFSEASLTFSKISPAIIIIDLIHPADSILMTVQTINSSGRPSQIVGAGEPQDVTLLMKFIKLGVKDFLSLPFKTEEIMELLKQIASRTDALSSPEISKRGPEGQIITFFSPKGGVGVTLLAANISVTLAAVHKTKVVACDLAPQCGDIATYLNLVPQYTVRDIVDNNGAFDQSFVESCLLTHVSGVKILAAPPEDQDALNADNLNTIKSIFSMLKRSFNTIIIDGSHLDKALLQYVMSCSDMIFLVGNPDVVSLKGLVSFFRKLQLMHYDTQKIKVLINRHNSKSQIDTEEFEKMTKHPITSYLPNNFMLCIEAVNTGQPLLTIHEKSDLSKKVSELAEIIFCSGNDGNKNSLSTSSSGTTNTGRESYKKGLFRCF